MSKFCLLWTVYVGSHFSSLTHILLMFLPIWYMSKISLCFKQHIFNSQYGLILDMLLTIFRCLLWIFTHFSCVSNGPFVFSISNYTQCGFHLPLFQVAILTLNCLYFRLASCVLNVNNYWNCMAFKSWGFQSIS